MLRPWLLHDFEKFPGRSSRLGQKGGHLAACLSIDLASSDHVLVELQLRACYGKRVGSCADRLSISETATFFTHHRQHSLHQAQHIQSVTGCVIYAKTIFKNYISLAIVPYIVIGFARKFLEWIYSALMPYMAIDSSRQFGNTADAIARPYPISPGEARFFHQPYRPFTTFRDAQVE